MDSDPSAAAEEPRRFTRGRLSRGKGLRKTTGCLTCRRRHVKCDEVRPRCGGCISKKTRCEYARAELEARRTRRRPDPNDLDQRPCNDSKCANDQEANTFVSATEPESPASRQQEAHVSEAPHRSSEIPSPEAPVFSDDQPDHAFPIENQPDGTVALGDEATRHMDARIGEPHQTSMESPGDYSTRSFRHIHPLVYDLPSPAQIPFQSIPIAHANSPDASLTLKWLDLLIGDATLNHGPLPDARFEPDGTNIFGNSAVQPEAAFEEIGAPHDGGDRTRAFDTPAIEARIETRNAYLRERLPGDKHQSREKDQAWQALERINLQTQELVLFRHFTDHISPWASNPLTMDLFEPQRPFRTLVPHLALHNVGLMNAVLALSARHLHIMNRDATSYAGGFRPTSNDIIGYYYKTLHYCQEAMQYDGYKTSLELLASAFIISAYEMLDGSNTDWEKHLKGVFWIQRSQIIHGHSDGLRQAVWWAWLCQDVWAAFREKRRPFTFWKPDRRLADLNPNELASRAVLNFAHVVGYCAQDDASKIPDYIAVKTREADLLSQQLDRWLSYLTLEFQPLPMAASDESNPFTHIWIQPSPFAISMQIYYCSLILLQLHRPCSGGYEEYLRKQRNLKRWASTVCGIAKTSSDDSSSVLSSQCVFIAGLVIEDPSQRSAVLDHLDRCRRRTGWPGYSLGDELKDLWRE